MLDLATFCLDCFEVSYGLHNTSEIQAENCLSNLCNGFTLCKWRGEKSKMYLPLFWLKICLNNSTYHCLYVLDETKEKCWEHPALFHEIHIVLIPMIMCLICSKHNWWSLWVSYLPKYLHTGKTFRDHRYVLSHFLVGTVFKTEYIFIYICMRLFCQATHFSVLLCFGGITNK